MAFDLTTAFEAIGGGKTLRHTKTYSGEGRVSIDQPVTDGLTDLEIAMTLDVSQVTAFYMVADQDMTVETNNAGAPVDTIVLKANVPYVWNSDTYDTFLLGTDVTKLFLTNGSGTDGTFKLEAVYDATP